MSDVERQGGLTDLEVALEVCDLADRISLAAFQTGVQASIKADGSPVTEVDRTIEDMIVSVLRNRCPEDGIVGEEGHRVDGTSGRAWLIDPIDGTDQFLRGERMWGTLLAMVEDGVPSVGVVSAPALGKRWWGVVGVGAWVSNDRNGQASTQVSTCALRRAVRIGLTAIDYFSEDLLRRLPALDAIGEVTSSGLGPLDVAEGALDAALTVGFGWDLMPLAAVVGAAGGDFEVVETQAGDAPDIGVFTRGRDGGRLVTQIRWALGFGAS